MNIRPLLVSPWFPLMAALLGVALTLPSVTNGLVLDDTVHRMMFLGPEELREELQADLGMFTFLNGDPDRNVRLKQLGILPWWSDPEIRLSFSRPVTEIFHWLDYRLWPESPGGMHLHNLVWFGLLVFGLALLYRSIEGSGSVAGLAVLLYAIDDAHSLPVAWIANRNALIATFFGVFALLLHDRWRKGPHGLAPWGSAACFLLSLLSAEAGVATAAYLFAYAFCLERPGWRRKIGSLAPYLILGGIWFAYHRWGGYGAHGSGFYVDPGHEPGRFFLTALERGPILFLGQWFVPPANLSALVSREWVVRIVLFGWFFVLLVAWILHPLQKRSPTARFWGVGMVLSIPPICSVTPSERLLFFVGIGGHALLATWLLAAFKKESDVEFGWVRRKIMRVLALPLILLHLVLAPLGLFVSSATTLPMVERPVRETALSLAETGSLEGRSILILNTPSPILSAYLGPRLSVEGIPLPENIWSLVPGIYPLTVERKGPRALVLSTPDSFLLRPGTGLEGNPAFDERYVHQGFATLYRNHEDPIPAGETIPMEGWLIEVTGIGADNQPNEITLRFDKPIEEADIDWYRWEDNQVIPFPLPDVGEKKSVEPVEVSFVD